MHFSTRLQRFAYARLLASYLTGSIPAFSSTLTTIALYDSSLRWFEARSRKLASRGLSLISCAARLLWKCLTLSSSFAPSWRTLVEMPFVPELRCATADLVGKVPPEFLRQAPDSFMADHNSTPSQQVFDHPQAEWKPKIEPDGVSDDLKPGSDDRGKGSCESCSYPQNNPKIRNGHQRDGARASQSASVCRRRVGSASRSVLAAYG
jgi:hypothetical protein